MSLFRVASLLLCCVLAALLIWVGTRIDYGYTTYIVKRVWQGKSISTCLDFPPEYWIKHEMCWAYAAPTTDQ